MPKVSIIVPVYNVSEYLRQCIESVMAQTYVDWEMILVDDGSTDGSGEIVDFYAGEDIRINAVHQQNMGLSGARNTGIGKAKGKYIYFLDSDDYIEKNLLECIINRIETDNAQMVAFNFRFDDSSRNSDIITEIKDGNIIIRTEEDLLEYYASKFMNWDIAYCVWNKLYCADIIKENAIFFVDTKEIFAEDICFNLYYGMYVQKISLMSDVLMSYRIRENSIMGTSADINKVNKLSRLGYKSFYHLANAGCCNEVINNYSIIFMNMLLSHYKEIKIWRISSALSSVDNKAFIRRMHKEYISRMPMAVRLLGINKAVTCLIYAVVMLVCQRRKKACYICFKGGLGNQIFQYALCRELEEHGSKAVYADLKYYNYEGVMPFRLKDVFGKSEVKCRFYKKGLLTDIIRKFVYMGKRTYREDGAAKYIDSIISDASGGVYDGYWQTAKYFRDIEDQLRYELKFGDGENKLDYKRKEIAGCNSISVHIRRGDYLKADDIYGGICTDEYYQRAIKYIKKNVVNPKFYFFSDDIEWVKRRYNGDDCYYIDSSMFDNYQDWYDMCLMSSCRHNIIANSSFSWWGAWLNDNDEKIVIAPERWLNNEDTPDIWYDGWIRL